ncbi:MAG TPA: SDR family oxidoreductase [Candidatus Binatia bacterium]|jgi:NAD(P)-dependent dehydrogenase (short-subunit alcohol dehydrogenase family)
MDLNLKGKVAIVTGGSKGIGKAITRALAEEGVNVAICARGLEELQKTAKEIADGTRTKILPMQADVKKIDNIKSLVSSTVKEFGGLDILVNNAASTIRGSILELSDEAWYNRFDGKVMGYIRCAREAVPHMIQRGGGRIVNIAGTAARSATSDTAAANGVANASVANVTKFLSDDLAKHGILVNCVHPGAVPTTPRAEQIAAQNLPPIGRVVRPAELADLVVFLCSVKASAITGQAICVDGGRGRAICY